jgi:ribosomal protein S18 acetylase RimI-like enzyme
MVVTAYAGAAKTIAPDMKRKGIAARLLARVCGDAADEGFDFVEAYPNKEFINEFHAFMGPRSMYEKFGFTVCAEYGDEYENRIVMRKALKR